MRLKYSNGALLSAFCGSKGCLDFRRMVGIVVINRCTAKLTAEFIENFTLGKGLKKIGKGALSDTVYSINYEGTMAEWNAIEKGEIWNGYAGGMYHLEKVICSDGSVPTPSITRN